MIIELYLEYYFYILKVVFLNIKPKMCFNDDEDCMIFL